MKKFRSTLKILAAFFLLSSSSFAAGIRTFKDYETSICKQHFIDSELKKTSYYDLKKRLAQVTLQNDEARQKYVSLKRMEKFGGLNKEEEKQLQSLEKDENLKKREESTLRLKMSQIMQQVEQKASEKYPPIDIKVSSEEMKDEIARLFKNRTEDSFNESERQYRQIFFLSAIPLLVALLAISIRGKKKKSKGGNFF